MSAGFGPFVFFFASPFLFLKNTLNSAYYQDICKSFFGWTRGVRGQQLMVPMKSFRFVSEKMHEFAVWSHPDKYIRT